MGALGKRYIMSVAKTADLSLTEPEGTQAWDEEAQETKVFKAGAWEALAGGGGAPPAGTVSGYYTYGQPALMTAAATVPDVYKTVIQSTVGSGNYWLGDGLIVGQIKRIVHEDQGGGGSGIKLQNGNGGFFSPRAWASININDAGQGAEVIWDGTAWDILDLFNELTPFTNVPVTE